MLLLNDWSMPCGRLCLPSEQCLLFSSFTRDSCKCHWPLKNSNIGESFDQEVIKGLSLFTRLKSKCSVLHGFFWGHWHGMVAAWNGLYISIHIFYAYPGCINWYLSLYVLEIAPFMFALTVSRQICAVIEHAHWKWLCIILMAIVHSFPECMFLYAYMHTMLALLKFFPSAVWMRLVYHNFIGYG